MKDNVVIIGGGIAGMEAARALLELGLSPIIIEQSDHLGGHVASWHRLFPDMTPARDVIDAIKAGMSGVNVFLETRVNYLSPLGDSYNVSLSNGVSIIARSIVIATGFELFQASKKEEYGYGVYDHVVTNADIEAWLSGVPDSRIPSDPEVIGFVHCVGSRDLKAGNSRCSKVCCTTAIKQAIELKEKFPSARIYCFYMDLRLFGKKYEDFYINAQRDFGVQFVRGRVSEVGETMDGALQVKAEDTLTGRPLKVRTDLLVLMSGMSCSRCTRDVASMLRLEVDDDGFFRSRNNISAINLSSRRGIFYAGACTGTKTVPETLAEARSAALEVYRYLSTEGRK